MLESFAASGYVVHSPCGPRKSGIPDSVEMPAPVRITMRLASSTHLPMEAIFIDSISAGSRDRGLAPKRTAPTPRGPEGPRARLLLRTSGDRAFDWFAGARGRCGGKSHS